MTGAIYLGPILHIWYSKLMPQMVSRIVRNTPNQADSLSKRITGAIPGTLLDQLLFAPPFLAGFFIFNSFVQDFKAESAKKGVEQVK